LHNNITTSKVPKKYDIKTKFKKKMSNFLSSTSPQPLLRVFDKKTRDEVSSIITRNLAQFIPIDVIVDDVSVK